MERIYLKMNKFDLTRIVIGISCILFAVLWVYSSSKASPLNFTEHVLPDPPVYGRIAGLEVYDLDEDGDPDILAGDPASNDIFWYRSDGAGNFTKVMIDVSATGDPRAFAIDDIDSDGDPDFVATMGNVAANSIVWYENNGSAVFTVHIIASTNGGSLGCDIADVDSDGDMDVVAGDYSQSTVHWFDNNGSESFTERNVYVGSNWAPSELRAVDVDADGDIDVVDTTNNWNEVSLLRNNGSEVFTKEVIDNTVSAVVTVDAGDIDGDGDIDLASGARSGGAVKWYDNNGAGVFTAKSVGSAGYAQDVHIADMNSNDNHMDIVVATYTNNTVLWFDNNGAETFTQRTVGSIGSAYQAGTGDFNLDGSTDVAAGSVSSEGGSWFESDYIDTSEPTVQASDISFSSVNYASMNISWTNGNGVRRIVFAKQANSGSASPSDNTTYTSNTTFGLGTQIGSTGWYAVYKGTGSSVSVTGLFPETDYIFHVIEYNGTEDGIENYLTDIATNNPKLQITTDVMEPITQATNLTFSSVSAASFNVSWTNGSGSARVVFIKEAVAGTTQPEDNITYIASATFGLGTQMGSTGWYAVYKGTGSNVTVAGLSTETIYNVQVFEYNGPDGFEDYLTDAATNNPKFKLTASASSSENFETGDFSNFSWLFGGNLPWVVTTSDKYAGTYSGKAGAITHSQSSYMEVNLNIVASGNITYYRKVSSESGYDYFRFYIDGVQKEQLSGTVAWSQVSFAVTAGSHTFKWQYSKDGSVSSGSDTVFVDDIVFPPTGVDKYVLYYDSTTGGSVSGSNPQIVETGGDGSTVTAVPDTGYSFVDWSDSLTDNPRTDAAITEDLNVTANFAVNSYTLTYTAGSGGSISGVTSQTVNYGSSGSAVTAIPDSGYHFVFWSDLSAQNPRTDTDITGDVLVEATFAKDAVIEDPPVSEDDESDEDKTDEGNNSSSSNEQQEYSSGNIDANNDSDNYGDEGVVEDNNQNNQAQNFSSKTFKTEVFEKDGKKFLAQLWVRVLDSNGNPLANIPVTIYSEPQTVVTNKEGVAVFTNVEVGTHKIVLSYNSQEIEKNVEISEPEVGEKIELDVIEVKLDNNNNYWWVLLTILFVGIGFGYLYLSKKKLKRGMV